MAPALGCLKRREPAPEVAAVQLWLLPDHVENP